MRSADRVTSVDVSRNLQLVISGSYQTWYAWDLISGDSVFELDGLTGWINDISLQPGRQLLSVADESNQIRLWETSHWTLTHNVQLEQVDQITALDFSVDGWTLALGAKNGSVLLWDMITNTLVEAVDVYPHAVTDLKIHPHGDRMITSYDNGVLRLWSIQH